MTETNKDQGQMRGLGIAQSAGRVPLKDLLPGIGLMFLFVAIMFTGKWLFGGF